VSKPAGSRWIALLLALYFVYFAAPALRAHFAIDDPMNLAFYWRRGLARSFFDVIAFWTDSYRPMAALFYMPIYHFFGMNPLPYRIASLAILAANLFLSYRIALRLTKSLAGATLTAVLVCAHPGMTALYYNTSQIYDVLAFFFTALMLNLYLRANERGGPNIWESIAIFAAFLAAISSKEIAVVGAVWILAYELLMQKKWKLILPAALIALAAAYTAIRALGPNSLSTQSGYRLVLTAHSFIHNAKLYANDISNTEFFNKNVKVVLAILLGTLLCAVLRKRELWWTWILVLTAALPIIFVAAPRLGASLYLPLLVVALWLSVLATAFFSERPAFQWFAAALIALMFVPRTLAWWNERRHFMLEQQQVVWSTLQAVEHLPVKPAPHSTVMFLNNPFADYDMWFIAVLAWNDHTIDPVLFNKHPDFDPKTFDWVYAFEGDQLKVVKAPASR
jgi:hypothetical protein